MRKFISKISLGAVALVFAMTSLVAAFPSPAAAISGSDFRADRIIDDSIFFDSSTMTGVDIQRFLESKVPVCDTNGTQPSAYGGTRAQWGTANGAPPPYTCLRDYQVDIPARGPDAYCSGSVTPGRKMAAQAIQDVSLACGINPKVMLVLLQKEQSFITDDWPWPVQYTKTTGYGCPDSALGTDVDANQNGCYDEFEGFFSQIYYAARQFQRYVKQSGSFSYRAGQVNYIQWHPNAGCGGTNVFIQNPATAALYNYTPYQPNAAALANLYGTGDGCSAYGNRNFWRLYSDWFGSPLTDRCNYNAPGTIITDTSFRNYQRNIGSGNFIIYSGTATNCVESHTWGVGFGSWQNNVASNLSVVNPAEAVVKYADLSGDGIDEPILLAFNNTGSGKVEFHVWEPSMRKWIVHAISNLSTTDVTNLAIDFADLNGDGKDDPVAIGYQNTGSGKVEFHVWGPGVQSWQSHDISNLDAPLNPVNMQIRFADLNGDNKDEAIAVGLNGTSTGKIEFHVWNPGFWSWNSHIESNSDTVNVSNMDLQFADFDGDRIDNGVLVGERGTATNKIEFHVWNPGLRSWQGHYTSNQAIL